MSHAFCFLKICLGVTGGKHTIPVFKLVLQDFALKIFFLILFAILSSVLTFVWLSCYSSMWLYFSTLNQLSFNWLKALYLDSNFTKTCSQWSNYEFILEIWCGAILTSLKSNLRAATVIEVPYVIAWQIGLCFMALDCIINFVPTLKFCPPLYSASLYPCLFCVVEANGENKDLFPQTCLCVRYCILFFTMYKHWW